jgi:hypothetical protein
VHLHPEIKPNVKWKKLLTKNPGCSFICCKTPSDIAYVLAIIKNGNEMGDQAKNDGGKTGDDVKKVGGKVVGGIINESNRNRN